MLVSCREYCEMIKIKKIYGLNLKFLDDMEKNRFNKNLIH